MTIQSIIKEISKQRNEAEFLTEYRLQGLEDLETAQPLKVERMNYEKWLSSDIVDQAVAELQKSSTESDELSKVWEIPQLEALREKGVYIESFQKVSQEMPILLTAHFTVHSKKELKNSEQLALHQSLFSEGLIVYFPKHFHSEETVEIIQHLDGFSIHNLLILMGENAEVNLVHKVRSHLEVEGQARVLVEFMSDDNSSLNYLSVNELSEKQPAYVLRSGFAKRNARIFCKQVELGEGDSIADTRIFLIGEGSESTIESIAISDKDQMVGINSQIINYASHTRGDIHQKGVTLDQSTLTFNGIGHIINQAKEADSQQESRILMLSENARGDTNPILLIDEFEVTAGHAASIGQMPEEEYYYLISRGITPHEAMRLYALGFLKSTLTGDFYEELYDLNAALERKMVHYDEIK